MTTITVKDQIIGFDKICMKSMGNITFKDTISLIFHAIGNISKTSDPTMKDWISFNREFETELQHQNKSKWPQLFIIKNDYDKRIDIFSAEPFIKSENILMLLLRMLYIENYKRPYILKAYEYHKILNFKTYISSTTEVKKLSLNDLFDLLKTYLTYYIKIYNDDKKLEYQLGKAILNQLN